MTDNSALPDATSAAGDTGRRIKAIIAASAGNLVEWYDFYAYSFTALYFASSFFPREDATAQLLGAAAVFAVGFFMRPIGGWFFGRYADQRGRKAAMLLSVLLMCAGSLAIAILPTYTQVGGIAPLLLLLVRMLQGFSLGGEYGASATYMSEAATSGRRGFFASFQYVTLIGGQLAAVLVIFLLQHTLGEAALKSWAWRLPFALGAVLAVVALYLRKGLHETAPPELRSKEAGTMRALFRHPRALATVIGLTACGSLIFYTFTTYMQKYLVNTAGMPAKTATAVMTWVLLAYMLMQPLFGYLSDLIGRRLCLILFGVGSTLCTVPILNALSTVQSPLIAGLLVLAALAIVSLYTSISGLFKAELFPMEVRALGVGFSYALANAIFGGSAEYVALWFKGQGAETWFYWYVSGMCAIGLITALTMGDLRKRGTLD